MAETITQVTQPPEFIESEAKLWPLQNFGRSVMGCDTFYFCAQNE